MNRQLEDSEHEKGKIFVGGLSWETTEEKLRDYFSKWGTVTDAVVMVDSTSQKPRGFGFVTFADPEVVATVTSIPKSKHLLDNKEIDPKPATTKSNESSAGRLDAPSKKIFVGGIAQNTSKEEIEAFFATMGTVTEVDLKFDKQTNRMRGFGFVGFDNPEVVEKIVATRFFQVNGKTVEAKKAQPRQTPGSYPEQSRQQQTPYSPYPYNNYGYHPQAYPQATQAQQAQYGGPANYYGYYDAANYAPQGYNSQSYGTGYERYQSGQQRTPAGQQQVNYQQSTAYSSSGGRTASFPTGTESYSTQTGYDYGYQQQQYGDSQGSSYARGGMSQPRSAYPGTYTH